MIGEFLDSWALFHNTFLAAWLVGLLLAPLGVFVVARDQIFIGAAVSQASVLGIAAAMGLAGLLDPTGRGAPHGDAFRVAGAVLLAVLASLLAARRRAEGEGTAEAVTGWAFLAAGSAAILLVSKSPYGFDEVQRLLSSSLIGATTGEVVLFAALLAVTVLALALRPRALVLFAVDPAMAAAVGVPTRAWSLALSAWLGLVVGLTMRASGMLYAFGALVLPALVAQELCREVRQMVWAAPAVSFAATTAALVVANHYDFPPGPLAVAMLAAALAATWGLRRLRAA